VSDWNERIIAEFRANDGVLGGPFAGSFLLLLTTTGARTGERRVVPLAYTDDADDPDVRILVASKTGSPNRPGWYHNVLANPRVHVEAATANGIDEYDAIASEMPERERAARYSEIMASRPAFAEFQQETHRVLPLVILTPASA
jgi:deazaflavin-dependent oxidoreductase (nitroreductase family)